jgi:hypothetical protein
MGRDLEPINPSPDAPRDEDGQIVWGRYNWAGWRWLVDRLIEWGGDVSEFSGWNAGDPIAAETCRKVADAIERHIEELDADDRQWLAEDISLWRTCGGYRQW